MGDSPIWPLMGGSPYMAWAYYSHNISTLIKLIMEVRTEILEFKKLTVQHFENQTEAFAAADALIQIQREQFPQVAILHSDVIFPGMPQLDQLWFVNYAGTRPAQN